MATYQNIGDTIEGEKTDGHARKWMPRGLKKHPVTLKTMFLYVTDRNSRIEVTEAGVIPEDEQLKNALKDCHRNVGDALECDSLSIYVNQKTPIKPDVKEGVSGRHGATLFHTAKQTIASIKTPIENVLKRLGYSNNSLENK